MSVSRASDFICPQCGAEVPRGARACPECGADDRTGWSEAAKAGQLDLPDTENFNYEEFVREEFGSRIGVNSRRLGWACVALVLLLALLALWVF